MANVQEKQRTVENISTAKNNHKNNNNNNNNNVDDHIHNTQNKCGSLDSAWRLFEPAIIIESHRLSQQ